RSKRCSSITCIIELFSAARLIRSLGRCSLCWHGQRAASRSLRSALRSGPAALASFPEHSPQGRGRVYLYIAPNSVPVRCKLRKSSSTDLQHRRFDMSKHNASRREFLRRAAGAGTVAGAGIVSEAFAQSHEQDPKSRPETNAASHPRSTSEG